MTHARDRRAVELSAQSLGAGLAGLVNLHDPEVITLAGIAPDLRVAAPDAGLMNFHRQDPPPIRDGIHGQEGPMRGAISLGVQEITSPAALARWDELAVAGSTR